MWTGSESSTLKLMPKIYIWCNCKDSRQILLGTQRNCFPHFVGVTMDGFLLQYLRAPPSQVNSSDGGKFQSLRSGNASLLADSEKVSLSWISLQRSVPAHQRTHFLLSLCYQLKQGTLLCRAGEAIPLNKLQSKPKRANAIPLFWFSLLGIQNSQEAQGSKIFHFIIQLDR